MNIEEILKMSKAELKKLSFKDISNMLELISQTFQKSGNDLDIEYALEIYKKGLDLLIIAKEKLTIAKEEKEKIDKKFEEIKSKFES
jgi:exonuclease VII small subunit